MIFFPVLLLIFIAVPIAEIWLIIQVGHVIGVLNTIGLLILDSLLGTWLFKTEGVKAWTRLTEAVAAGRMPTKELVDGALVVLGGALLIAPGFITDVLGLLCVLPFTRPVVRGLMMHRAAKVTNRNATRTGGVHVIDVRDHPPHDEYLS